MTATRDWDAIRQSAIDRAILNGAPGCVIIDREQGGWFVPSSDPTRTGYLVTAKVRRGNGNEGTPARRGMFWHLLNCDCQAAASGFSLCWHKAAVFLHWLERKHMAEYLRKDPPMLVDGPGEATPEDQPTVYSSEDGSLAKLTAR